MATKTTPKQAAAIADFMSTARGNGVRVEAAALPTGHPMVKGRKVMQIRVVKDMLAWGQDELGNTVALCADGFVRQFLGQDGPQFAHPDDSIVVRDRTEVVAELAARFGKSVEFAAKFYAAMSTVNLCKIAARSTQA